MPTLYSHADSNRRKTYLLLLFFIALVIFVGWWFSYLLNDSAILYFAIIVSILMSWVSYWWSDKIILMTYRAQPIEKKDHPELYRIVENLCITAGLPLPKIYIIPERQPNAFATGRNPKHAVVAVTQGLLDRLEKSELEGVIAHELSHIGNRDMLLMTIAAILAGVVAILANTFLRINFRRVDDRRGGAVVVLMALGLISAILAPLAATLVRLAISRKREFLADATAALITRYPEGLARALEKISQDSTPMRIVNDATSSLFIESPYKGRQKQNWFVKMFMTHPPVEERIRILREMEV